MTKKDLTLLTNPVDMCAKYFLYIPLEQLEMFAFPSGVPRDLFEDSGQEHGTHTDLTYFATF